jgi:hypothetical protein
MSKYFSVEGAENGIVSAVAAKAELEEIGVFPPEALAMNHVVMQWVLGQEPSVCRAIVSAGPATKENIGALDGLWEMIARHGIVLDEAQKIALYQDFLDD